MDRDYREIYPEIHKYCEENFPNHRMHLIKEECSDTAIAYLHDPEANWLSGCKVVYWNQWYPDEYDVFELKHV